MVYFIFCAPESPKYLYSKNKFDKCRDALRQVREYHCGSDEQDPKASRKFNFMFDKEAIVANESPRTNASSLPDLEQEAEALITSNKADDANQDNADLLQSTD